MAKKRPILEEMRANPRADWTIADVEKACKEHHIDFMAPSKGTHYKAASPHLTAHLTIPAHRPIKAVYIKALVGMIDAHLHEAKRRG